MKKFVNHVDHVVWLARPETIERHVADLEELTDAKLLRFEHPDMDMVFYIDWAAGLEVFAPLPQRTARNAAIHDQLEARGEGLFSVVFGVENLERHRAQLEAKGIALGPLLSDHPDTPWHDRLVLRERPGAWAINSGIVFGQIDYADDVIRFEDVEAKAEADSGRGLGLR